MRAKAAPDGTCQTDPRQTPDARTARRRWVALIKQVWQVDPLTCPRCRDRFKIHSTGLPWSCSGRTEPLRLSHTPPTQTTPSAGICDRTHAAAAVAVVHIRPGGGGKLAGCVKVLTIVDI